MLHFVTDGFRALLPFYQHPAGAKRNAAQPFQGCSPSLAHHLCTNVIGVLPVSIYDYCGCAVDICASPHRSFRLGSL